MLIRIPAGGDCHESEVTSEAIYRSRRRFIQGAALAGAAVGVPLLARAAEQYPGVPVSPAPPWFVGKLGDARWRAVVAQGEAITPYADATQYNNFYEFGPNKGDPARYAAELKVEPWTVLVDGEVEKPGRYSLDDLFAEGQLEERIYRLRCVEAWSMVIPWLGFPPPFSCEVRPLRNGLPARRDAWNSLQLCVDRLAVRRRIAHGRGDAPPQPAGGWNVWAGTA